MKRIRELESRWQNHLMVLAAFRYCLGRQSYIVSECGKWLYDYWDDFPETTRAIILKETEEALENGTAGDDCDRSFWLALLESIEKRAASIETAPQGNIT